MKNLAIRESATPMILEHRLKPAFTSTPGATPGSNISYLPGAQKDPIFDG